MATNYYVLHRCCVSYFSTSSSVSVSVLKSSASAKIIASKIFDCDFDSFYSLLHQLFLIIFDDDDDDDDNDDNDNDDNNDNDNKKVILL